MATIKSYTDIEQSKRLAEILPLESADMFYAFESINGELHYHLIIITEHTNRNFIISEYNSGRGIVSWSLTALLGVLPKGTNISTPCPINELSYCCWNQYDEIYASNPVDACYEMILKLHEQNLL